MGIFFCLYFSTYYADFKEISYTGGIEANEKYAYSLVN